MHRRPGCCPRDDRGNGVLALRRRVVFASCWVLSVILSGEVSLFSGSFLPSFLPKEGSWAVSPWPESLLLWVLINCGTDSLQTPLWFNWGEALQLLGVGGCWFQA